MSLQGVSSSVSSSTALLHTWSPYTLKAIAAVSAPPHQPRQSSLVSHQFAANMHKILYSIF